MFVILGIMCTATALIIGRDIRLVGTVNYQGQREKYTLLESVPASQDLPPLNIGFVQVNISKRHLHSAGHK